jgi:hypothetical protein
MPVESPRHGIVEVAQEMPPIADLDGIRSAGSDAVGIAVGAITGNDLSAGMILQPGRVRPPACVGCEAVVAALPDGMALWK